ncbi:MAG TPA: phosphate ABC transporter permease PstA [Mycobacteriales bacterium]|nr:phosphate ABC transporter permease PstA [Mycobacteriales bacterium]
MSTESLPMPSVSGNLPDGAGEDRPRELAVRTTDDVLSFFGSLFGSLGAVWIVYGELLPEHGLLGFIVCWYLSFLALYTAVTAMSHPRPVVVDRLMRAIICAGAGIVAFALATTIIYTFVRGWPALHHMNFYTQDMNAVQPTDPLTRGGVLHAVVGSLIELAIATAVALPLGIATAVYMTEVGGPLARTVRTVVEAMTALPDLIAGLFVYTLLIVGLGMQKSGLAAAIALTITMLPIIARSAELSLRVVPGGLREAGLALGAPKWRMVWRVVLPTAGAGLATALILAFARAVGETAPVLITSGASTYFNTNPVNNPMNSLPLFVYSGVRSGEPNFITRAFGAASLLLIIVLVVFVLIRFLASRQKGSVR